MSSFNQLYHTWPWASCDIAIFSQTSGYISFSHWGYITSPENSFLMSRVINTPRMTPDTQNTSSRWQGYKFAAILDVLHSSTNQRPWKLSGI